MANPLLRDISLSEARRQLSALLRRIHDQPDIGYRLLVHNRVAAELRSPRSAPGGMSAAALLRAAEKIKRSRPRKRKGRVTSASENYKEILYGKNGILRTRPGR